jgi:hypothetical protein
MSPLCAYTVRELQLNCIVHSGGSFDSMCDAAEALLR